MTKHIGRLFLSPLTLTGVGAFVVGGGATNRLLLETGDYLLLENGDFFELE